MFVIKCMLQFFHIVWPILVQYRKGTLVFIPKQIPAQLGTQAPQVKTFSYGRYGLSGVLNDLSYRDKEAYS